MVMVMVTIMVMAGNGDDNGDGNGYGDRDGDGDDNGIRRVLGQKVKYFTLLGSFPVSRASSISWFGTGENTLKFSKPSALSFFIASTRTSTYV